MLNDHVITLLNVALDAAEEANKKRGWTVFHNDLAARLSLGDRVECATMTVELSGCDYANLEAVLTVKRPRPKPFAFTVTLQIMAVGEGDHRLRPYRIVGLRITKPAFLSGEAFAQKWAGEVLAQMRERA